LPALFIARDCRDYMRGQQKRGEEKLSKLLSFVAVAALALSFSSGAKAHAASGDGVAKSGALHHHHWQPRKHHYGKRMRAHWGARCKMTGSC
jgi:hypothetical protein